MDYKLALKLKEAGFLQHWDSMLSAEEIQTFSPHKDNATKLKTDCSNHDHAPEGDFTGPDVNDRDR